MSRSVLAFAGLLMVLVLSGSVRADEELQPTHVEIEPLTFELGHEGSLETIAMDRGGRLLAGVSWAKPGVPGEPPPAAPVEPQPPRRGGARQPPPGPAGPREYAVRVLDAADGRVVETWPLDVAPKMLHGCDDGTILVGSNGAFRLLNEKGEVTTKVGFGDFLDGEFADAHCSGVTADAKHFFVAFGHGWSLRATEDIVRFDRDLSNAKLIVKQQFGCCAHIDLDVRGDELLVAENSRHRVNRFDHDGNRLGTWGRRDRVGIEGFAACCNPVNFDFGPDGVLYTAESGIGRVKTYKPDGEYLGFVGWVDTTKFDRGSRLAAMSCYIPIEVSADGDRVYVMDVRANFIRVLQRKK